MEFSKFKFSLPLIIYNRLPSRQLNPPRTINLSEVFTRKRLNDCKERRGQI